VPRRMKDRQHDGACCSARVTMRARPIAAKNYSASLAPQGLLRRPAAEDDGGA
jgi:hypothetical protein